MGWTWRMCPFWSQGTGPPDGQPGVKLSHLSRRGGLSNKRDDESWFDGLDTAQPHEATVGKDRRSRRGRRGPWGRRRRGRRARTSESFVGVPAELRWRRVVRRLWVPPRVRRGRSDDAVDVLVDATGGPVSGRTVPVRGPWRDRGCRLGLTPAATPPVPATDDFLPDHN